MFRFKLLVIFFSALVITLRTHSAEVNVDTSQTLDMLIQDEDTDGDKKITIEDCHIAGSQRGDKKFWLETIDHRKFEVVDTYYLSNLLQELSLASDRKEKIATLEFDRIFEPPVDRISRSIRELYWDGLTRRIDEDGLIRILSDEKTSTVDGFRYIYVPHDDKTAYSYFQDIANKQLDSKIKVVALPETITPAYVRNLDGHHGIVNLSFVRSNDHLEGAPFVVPGGRFNEMYGWDSYFIALGLLQDNRVELAKSMVDNFVYEIEHYGKILNANRTYYLTRSQPPFFTSMALAVYHRLPANNENKNWLRNVLQAAIKEYFEVWMSSSRLTRIGLNRYFDSGFGPPPEVEPSHFDVLYSAFAKKNEMEKEVFEAEYESGKRKVAELDAYFVQDRCMRESGHDTSYRLEGRCADLVTVDLNALLYKVESDLAATIKSEFGGILTLDDGRITRSSEWDDRAKRRKDLIDRYLWNSQRGMYFDYDFVQGRQMDYVSATTFYPLWAKAASKEQAQLLIQNALPLLEMPGGLASSTEQSRGPITQERPLRQWDFPHGWSPHQILAWLGFLHYGYDEIAYRLIYRWLYSITINAAQYHGTVPEKFDVVSRSHQVFAEYGNVGTKFSYITREGFGWTNASYQVGLAILPSKYRTLLNQLIPPEWVF